MKSMNCISTTGRMPMCAAPAAAPTMPISEIGESINRRSPNLSTSPSATLNAPAHGSDFVDRRVDPPLLAELLQQPVGDLERAAVPPNVLADAEHVRVALH